MPWNNANQIGSRNYTCGFCGNIVASSNGFSHQNNSYRIYLCPHCEKPTYFGWHEGQIPGVAPGYEVKALPPDIEGLYSESRNSVAASAYTGAVLLSRKLLMNIAVTQGAPTGKPFIEYVEYLAANGYVPPNGKGWVDHIRKKGNEATHEIVAMSRQDAEDLISFTEMLLKFIYEFPSGVPAPTP